MNNFFLATYLAIKEVIRNRGRFFLVALVIALITVLVLFIAALGEGLSDANRQYVANLDAQLIVFLEKSDYSITASRLETNTAKAVRRVEGVADAGPIYTSNSEIVSLPEPLKISMLGVEAGRPGMPPLLEGRYFRGGGAREAVMDMSVAQRTNLKIGDEIEIRSTQGTDDQFYTLEIVGLVDEQAYFFQPTIFVPATTWELMRPQSESDLNSDTPFPNIIAVKLTDPSQVEAMKTRLEDQISNIEVADIETTINNIPGYTAQQGTVQTQGVFTLLIGILVIGGFFQIQILQKVPQIGVLKAIGSSNFVVGLAAIIQIIIVTAMGVGIGAGLNYLFSLGLPPSIPLAFNGTRSLIAIALLLFIGPLGGMVSIIYAVRIEPLKALRLG
ncbi:MAG: ABC transporter permease [Anaerolineales bacterium]|jgi:putative ABC transport system permease protein|uniref:ABC transporter permease n=1 Tax=Candidatus Villigracilis affinis TaxID=3140682 RepID=UPI001DC98A3A|nr:ABC transporter permease [Anaerolineales bacterium]MBK9604484.1 ABC transporter permease [Anaerolineales bacterium]MBL0343693.1 ABC transporter permease [Anaerolineales bacterium]